MYAVENIRSGQREYLANTEEKNLQDELELRNLKAMDHKQFDAYCKENKLDFNKANFERYLNNGQTHYKAQVSDGMKEVFGIKEYSRKDYEKLLSGENPLSQEQFKKLNPDLAYRKDGRLVKKAPNQKLGIDSMGGAEKSVSILWAVSGKETKDKIANAMFKTAEQQNKLLASQLTPSNKGKKYQDFDPSQTKTFAFTYLHTDTRPDEKNKSKLTKEQIAESIDTHIHTHTHTANVAQFAFYKRDKNGEIILGADGKPDYDYKMLAVDNEQAFKRQLENSAVYDAMLNSNLQAEGIKTESHIIKNAEKGTLHETFKVVGVSREMELACSNRSQSYFEKNKNQTVRERQKGFKNTKNSKIEFTASELERTIANNTANAIGSDNIQKILDAQKTGTQETKKIDMVEIVRNKQELNLAGFVKETELRREIVKAIQHERPYKDINDLNNAVDSKIKELADINKNGRDSIVAVENQKGKIVGYTRLSNAITERAYIENLKQLSTDTKTRNQDQIRREAKFLNDFIKEAEAKGKPFNKGQIKSMLHSLSLGYEGGRVLGINGAPGSGKTSSNIAFNVALNKFRNGGENKILGISTANVATNNLSDANISQDRLMNSAKLIARAFKEQPDGTYKFNEKFINDPKNQNNLYIFDEYGLEQSKNANLILELAKKTNSDLLYVGDENQLKSVGYGNPMQSANNLLKEQNPDKVVYLDEIMRQRNDRALQIVKDIEKGDGNKLFELLEKEKALTIAKTEKGLISQVAKDYLDDDRDAGKKIIVCNTNATIDELNKTIRDKLTKDNPNLYKNEVNLTVSRQGKDIAIERQMRFGEGERIVFLKGMKETDPKTGIPVKNGWTIDNSQLAIIEKIKRGQSGSYDLTVNVDGKSITFNTAKDGNYFSNAYAVSVYKSQGSTVENVRHISTGGTEPKNSIYVSASRHTGSKDIKDDKGNIVEKGELGYHLYLAEKYVDKFKDNLNLEQTKFTTLNNAECEKAVADYTDIAMKRIYGENYSKEPVKIAEKEILPMPMDKERFAIERGKILRAEKELEVAEFVKEHNLENNTHTLDLTARTEEEFKQKLEKAKALQPKPESKIEIIKDTEIIAKEVKEEIKAIQEVEIKPQPLDLSTMSRWEMLDKIEADVKFYEENRQFLQNNSDKELFAKQYIDKCKEVYADPKHSLDVLKTLDRNGISKEVLQYAVENQYLDINDPTLSKYTSKENLLNVSKELELRDSKEHQTLINTVKELKNDQYKNTQTYRDKLEGLVNTGALTNKSVLEQMDKRDLNKNIAVDKIADHIKHDEIKINDANFKEIASKVSSENLEKISQKLDKANQEKMQKVIEDRKEQERQAKIEEQRRIKEEAEKTAHQKMIEELKKKAAKENAQKNREQQPAPSLKMGGGGRKI